MIEAFQTIYEGGVGEYVMKKSRFIATVCPIETEEAATKVIDNLKKKYWDASHNCSAFIIGTENQVMRCSDDGEPSSTAGRPMLDVLSKHELTNLVVVVTRYFGGTLLGTGGLVKAYQSAALEGLNNSKIITKKLGIKVSVTTDYNMIGKIQHHVVQDQITTLSSEYTDIVKLILLIPPSRLKSFINKTAELTNGSALMEELDSVYFAFFDGEVHIFP